GRLASTNLLKRLEAFLPQGKGIPRPEALGYIRQLALALDYLNAPRHILDNRLIGLTHRNVRPVNILVEGSTVRLGNWSMVRALLPNRPQIDLTDSAASHGFLAPEAMQGKVHARSDQFSLALTYLQVRTGVLPTDEPDAFSSQTTWSERIRSIP